MRASTRRWLAAGLFGVMIGIVQVAPAQSANPHSGAWKLNVATSKYSPGTATKSGSFEIEAAGAGINVGPASGDAVTVWNANAGVAATAACLAPLADPFHEARMYAMMHVAIHDALNAIDRRSRPYAVDLRRIDERSSPDAAVAAAARVVLVSLITQLPLELVTQECIDAGVASVEAAYTVALAAIPNAQAKALGIAVGQAAAAAILYLRAEDGAVGPFLNLACPQHTNPGQYQCTPGTPFIVFEVWENVIPFVLNDRSQFRPGPPYAVNTKRYTADFNEVKYLGGDDVTTPSARTADQTEIALYLVGKLPAEVEPDCQNRCR